MARYPEGHKQETRDRILDAAARRFKTDGLTGAGIGPVMADAGLTNGGFYAHFASKDDLICAVVRREIAAQT
ncbi:MAG: TetR family transcriptional regulator, partial [Propioniciclava sp.]